VGTRKDKPFSESLKGQSESKKFTKWDYADVRLFAALAGILEYRRAVPRACPHDQRISRHRTRGYEGSSHAGRGFIRIRITSATLRNLGEKREVGAAGRSRRKTG
jgi:hypothetical protein